MTRGWRTVRAFGTRGESRTRASGGAGIGCRPPRTGRRGGKSGIQEARSLASFAFGKWSANMARARNIRARHTIFMRVHAAASSRRSRSLAARKKLSFLARAVVAGFGQAGHVEFDRITAFVASGGNETTNNAGQGQNETAHGLLPIGFCLGRVDGFDQDEAADKCEE